MTNTPLATFTLAYTLLTLLSGVAGYLLGFSNAGLNLVVAMAAAFLSAATFVKTAGRVPTPEERSRFAWAALGMSLLVSLILFVLALAILFKPEERENLLVLLRSGAAIAAGAIGLLVGGLLYWLVIRWAFGWYAARAAR